MNTVVPTTFQYLASQFRTKKQLARQPQLYDVLGPDLMAQAETIAEKILPGEHHLQARQKRQEIFEYIVLFLHHSTFQAPLHSYIGKGYNLARRPYLAPTGFRTTNQDGEELPDFFYFAEQYRWDTFFHNQLFQLLGFQDLAIGQLLNFVDVFQTYHRIPNALTTDFLSHPQPPTEALSAQELIRDNPDQAKTEDWFHQVMRMVEADLFSEWWDFESERMYPRQTQDFVKQFGPYISRYVSIHMHPLLVGCQDGKDHNWVSAYYGENYIPVQLNCLLWANVQALKEYYTDFHPDPEKAHYYQQVHIDMRKQLQKLFWVESGRWRGFRNYSMGTHRIPAGSIYYGDLAAEIFPLYVGLATPEQARITLENLQTHYEGDIGLASSSPSLREGGSIPREPEGYEFQWEYNAWPPLMIVAIAGLERYSEHHNDEFAQYARKLKIQWVRWIEEEFTNSKQSTAHHGQPAMHEKAPYSSSIEVKPGFYGNLRGFGWTVSSYLQFLKSLGETENVDFLTF